MARPVTSEPSHLRRLRVLAQHIAPDEAHEVLYGAPASAQALDHAMSLTVTDNRTGKTYTVPISDSTIPATAFLKFEPPQEGAPPLRVFDPGYKNTAAARSAICYIDGPKGELFYRGYAIEELAEKSSFVEVSYLLINGNLPTKTQLSAWEKGISQRMFLHENMNRLMTNYRFNAHPMGMMISCIAALGTFYPEANPALAGEDVFEDTRLQTKQIYRILGKMPTLAANAYRHRMGRPFNTPNQDMGYVESFLYMLDHLSEDKFRPHPTLVKALDVIFILHAEHDLNCSTAAMRHITSAKTDPYTAVAGAAGALYGPLHGGANQRVLQMLEEIGSVANIPQFISDVKARKKKLMGFGHRVYRNYDPRAKIMRKVAYEVFDVCGHEPLIEIALALEKVALEDDYFVKRKLFPNVDFYSGLVFRSMGFPTDMFPVLFCIPRTAGWLAHWVEGAKDTEQKIWRPRQIYNGAPLRSYVPLNRRQYYPANSLEVADSAFWKRSRVSNGDSPSTSTA